MHKIIINLIVGSSLLLAFLIFLNPNKHNKQGNRWLSLFVFCLFILNIDEFLAYNSLQLNFQFFLLSLFIVTPIFYFSVVYFINPTKKWKPIYYLHFAFGLFVMLFERNTIILKDEKLVLLTETISEFAKYSSQFLMYIVLPLQAIFYISYSYLEIVKHGKNINQFSSNTNEIDLKWLKKILYYIVFLGVLFVIDLITNRIEFLNFILLIGIYYIGYYAIKQKEIYPFSKNKKVEIAEIIEINDDKNKFEIEKKKLISDEKLLQIKTSLIEIMQDEKPFLNQELTLIILANNLKISAHNLSFAINESFNENFNQFVNRYRIEEAKKMILDPKMNHLSISGIGYEVGFNSKSVFNATFKKLENCTPLQYKNQDLILEISSEL